MRSRRDELRISQEDLAEISGLHRTYISDIERSRRNVGIDNLERIAEALQLPLDRLLLATDQKRVGHEGKHAGEVSDS
ncbi:helix-turn-helix domain-containing protein [Arthrobacter sp. TE12232]